MISLHIYQVLVSSCWIIQAHSLLYSSPNFSNHSLLDMHFRCNDGKYVSGDSFCSGSEFVAKYFCYDGTGSHNSYGCDTMLCGIGQFKCENGSCLPISVRCNTIADCSDGSDELNCGDEVNVGNCSLADGKFLCHDKLRCLGLENTCDHECNCFDCSDENENCTKHDEKLLDNCLHSYFTTPNGPMCFCNSSNPEMKNLCKEVKPCTKENFCSQRCTKFRSKISCSCYANYSFIDATGISGFVCASKVSYDNLLAYSTSNQIKIVNLTSGENIFVKKKVQCGDIVGARDHLYYTTYDDGDRKTIYKISISSGATTKVIQSNSSIVSIAVDYITENLYFTTNTSLSVCSNDGRICTQLKCCNVRYVALTPKFGLMFYMKKFDYQEEKFIMKSAMDGSNEDYVLDGSFPHFSPLAVDESTRKLYWSQWEENEIWSLSFDEGYEELRSIRYHGTLKYFTVLDSELFFTKLWDNEIYRVQNIESYAKYIKKSFNIEARPIYDSGIVMDAGGYLSSVYDPVYAIRAAVLPDNRVKRRIRPTWGRFPSLVMNGIPLSDSNATRLVDNNVTFIIKNLYAYNSQWHTFSKNPCSKTSCNGLCLIRRGTSSMNDSDYVCVCENLPLKSDQNWCNDFHPQNNPLVNEDSNDVEARENKPSLLKSQPEETHGVFMVTVVLAIAFIISILVLGVHFVVRKQSWSEYYDALRYCRFNKSIEQVNICNQVELQT